MNDTFIENYDPTIDESYRKLLSAENGTVMAATFIECTDIIDYAAMTEQ